MCIYAPSGEAKFIDTEPSYTNMLNFYDPGEIKLINTELPRTELSVSSIKKG